MNNLEAIRSYYQRRDYVFLGEIDQESTAEVISDLARAAMSNPEHINMVFCSPGGITDMGFAIAEFIEFELDVPVHARVFGMCNSAATYPLLCCQERVSNELTTFVIHRQTSSIQLEYGERFEKEVSGWHKDNEVIHERQIRFYSQKLGESEKFIEILLERGSASTNNQLTAAEALQLGLLTKVLPLSKAAK